MCVVPYHEYNMYILEYSNVKSQNVNPKFQTESSILVFLENKDEDIQKLSNKLRFYLLLNNKNCMRNIVTEIQKGDFFIP